MTLQRLHTVNNQLIQPMANLGHHTLVANDRDAWQACLSSLSDRYLGNELRYGWTVPFKYAESKTGLGIAFFPTLIVEQTAEESDTRFDRYLDAIEYRMNYQFAFFGDDEKTDKIDAMLYDAAPGNMDVLNSIQLRVLDQEANANGPS